MPDDPLYRSAWLKWAHAVELRNDLARSVVSYRARQPHEFVRWDNLDYPFDPVVRMHWKLRVREPHPERWSVLLGDYLASLRDALDHLVWAAVHAHHGPPPKPQQIHFPIAVTNKAFRDSARSIEQLLAPEVWDAIERVQPYHGGAKSHTHPLAVLAWLSNRDKHKAVHVVNRQHLAMLEPDIKASRPVAVYEKKVYEGDVTDGSVVARLKYQRLPGGNTVDVVTYFVHGECLQISDTPKEYRLLASALQVMIDHVLELLFAFDELAGQRTDPDTLYMGEPLSAEDEAGFGAP